MLIQSQAIKGRSVYNVVKRAADRGTRGRAPVLERTGLGTSPGVDNLNRRDSSSITSRRKQLDQIKNLDLRIFRRKLYFNLPKIYSTSTETCLNWINPSELKRCKQFHLLYNPFTSHKTYTVFCKLLAPIYKPCCD